MAQKKNGSATASEAEWKEIESAALSGRGSNRTRAPSAARSGVYDPASDPVLKRLAARSLKERGRGTPEGNVVFLPGICGSDLSVGKKIGGALDTIWVSYRRILIGAMERLKLAADAKREHDSTLRVQATAINKRFYARAIVALRAHWDVEPFAYDWRRDIDEASDALATFIENRFGDEPVHLVAHSLGGLVSRNMIRRHPKLWERMADGTSLERGGRLIMLGTPNYGSFAIAQVLTGQDPLIAKLAGLDVGHSLDGLLKILNTFLGTYMLLPAHSKLDSSLRSIFEEATWGGTAGISQRHLDRAYDFYKTLDTTDTLDKSRLIYVAGADQTTIASMKVRAPGDFQYEFTTAGDGRVPHALGLLPGVPAYYVDAIHGDLARDEAVLRALDDLLTSGRTTQLSTSAPAARAAAGRRYRSGPERTALQTLDAMSKQGRGIAGPSTVKEQEEGLVNDAVMQVILGSEATVRRSDTGQDQVQPRDRGPKGRQIKLRVGVKFGRIEEFKAGAVVVGHYRGVQPVKAIGAIDDRLDNWIERAVKRDMISGHLGEAFFVPSRGKIPAEGVIVAGMGDPGRFSSGALRQVAANVAQAACSLHFGELGTVLIGAGEGHLSLAEALQCLLEGFGSGLVELREEKQEWKAIPLKALWIVECHPGRFEAIDQLLKTLADVDPVEGIDFERVERTLADRRKAQRALSARQALKDAASNALNVAQRGSFDSRLTVEYDRSSGKCRSSALTSAAVVPSREFSLAERKLEGAAQALAGAETPDDQRKYGRLLFDMLFPEDFQSILDRCAPVRLIVDSTTAALPFEMACRPNGRTGGVKQLGTDCELTRQFRTSLSRAPGLFPPRNGELRALVIADPAPEEHLQLAGARSEGRLVAKMLRKANGTAVSGGPLRVSVEERIGSGECDPIELLALISSGEYDIIHFAGHGEYHSDEPEKSGWILDRDSVVSPTDIFRTRQVPWLVVANACFSGALRTGDPYPSLDAARRKASIIEAFMERGVPNYLGTGWTVDDGQAERFAASFYGSLLDNQRLGTAVKKAREDVLKEGVGSTWGAYQFYGDPNDRLVGGSRLPDDKKDRKAKPRARRSSKPTGKPNTKRRT